MTHTTTIANPPMVARISGTSIGFSIASSGQPTTEYPNTMRHRIVRIFRKTMVVLIRAATRPASTWIRQQRMSTTVAIVWLGIHAGNTRIPLAYSWHVIAAKAIPPLKPAVNETRPARNPQNGELIYVPKRNKVRFRASKKFKEFINKWKKKRYLLPAIQKIQE